MSYRLVSCGSVEEHMYCRQVFKAGLSQSVLGDSGGGPMDPSWGAADADAADESPKGAGGTSVARIVTKGEAESLLRLGSTESCDTQRLLDAVVPRGGVSAAALAAAAAAAADAAGTESPLGLAVLRGVGVVEKHIAGLAELLGPTCCVGVARHDVLLGLTEERLAALRSFAGLPCAALASASDVPPDPAQVALWFDKAAAALLLPGQATEGGERGEDPSGGPKRLRLDNLAVKSGVASGAADAEDNTGGALKQEDAVADSATVVLPENEAASGSPASAPAAAAALPKPAAGQPKLFDCLVHASRAAVARITESLRIVTPAWALDEACRQNPAAASHLRVALRGLAPLPPRLFLAAAVRTLGAFKALTLLARVEVSAVREWSVHGRRGRCGDAHCCSISAAVAGAMPPRLSAFLARHPDLNRPGGQTNQPVNSDHAPPRAFPQGASAAPAWPAGAGAGSALGKHPRSFTSPGAAGNPVGPSSLTAAAASALVEVRRSPAPALAPPDQQNLATAAANAVSAVLLLSCLDQRLQGGAPVAAASPGGPAAPSAAAPPGLSTAARDALAAAQGHLAAAVGLLRGPVFASVSDDAMDRLRAISTRLASADGLGDLAPSAAVIQASTLGQLLPWATGFGGSRLAKRLEPRAVTISTRLLAGARSPAASAATAGVANAQAGRKSGGPAPAPAAAASSSANASGAAAGPSPGVVASLISQIGTLLHERLAALKYDRSRLSRDLAPLLDADAVSEAHAIIGQTGVDEAARVNAVVAFVKRLVSQKNSARGAPSAPGPSAEFEDEYSDGSGSSESEYEQLPEDACGGETLAAGGASASDGTGGESGQAAVVDLVSDSD